MHFTGDDGFQNMFAYQPAFSTLQLKKGLTIKELTIFNYVKELTILLVGNHKGNIALLFFLSTLFAFFHSIKSFRIIK